MTKTRVTSSEIIAMISQVTYLSANKKAQIYIYKYIINVE